MLEISGFHSIELNEELTQLCRARRRAPSLAFNPQGRDPVMVMRVGHTVVVRAAAVGDAILIQCRRRHRRRPVLDNSKRVREEVGNGVRSGVQLGGNAATGRDQDRGWKLGRADRRSDRVAGRLIDVTATLSHTDGRA